MKNKTKIIIKIIKIRQIEYLFNNLAKKAIKKANKLKLNPQKALFFIAKEQKNVQKNI